MGSTDTGRHLDDTQGHSTATLGPAVTGERDVPKRRRWPLALGAALLLLAAPVVIFSVRRDHPPAATASEGAGSEPPPPSSARVRVETVPPGAQVEWNGMHFGPTPTEIPLEPGKQRLMLSRDGFDPEALTVDAKPGEEISRVVTLHAHPEPPPPVVETPPARASAPTRVPTAKPTAPAPRLKIKMIEEPEGE